MIVSAHIMRYSNLMMEIVWMTRYHYQMIPCAHCQRMFSSFMRGFLILWIWHKNAICYLAVCQNLVPLVNIKIAGKWMFIPLKMVLIGIDPYPSLGWFSHLTSILLYITFWGFDPPVPLKNRGCLSTKDQPLRGKPIREGRGIVSKIGYTVYPCTPQIPILRMKIPIR
jgi:hypothetical protein